MGERSDSATVREGSDGALVEGRLFSGARDEEGFVIQRRLGSYGRSRVRVDGSLASVRELSERVRPLIELCGQHEHQRLLDSASHVGMVDAWAGAGVAEALAISDVDPKPGELEELEERLPRVEHAESLACCANDAAEALTCEGGALDALNTAIAELSRMARVDVKLSEFADQLSGAAITVEDAAAELRRYRDSVDFDPAELAAAQERYSAFKGLMRQWGPHMEDVFARRDEARRCHHGRRCGC